CSAEWRQQLRIDGRRAIWICRGRPSTRRLSTRCGMKAQRVAPRSPHLSHEQAALSGRFFQTTYKRLLARFRGRLAGGAGRLKELLVGSRVLHNQLRLAVDGEHERPSRVLELLE